MKNFLKQNLFKIIVSVLFAALAVYSVWSWLLLRQIIQVDNNQGAQITLQGAAWQVFVSSLDEKTRGEFTNAVNKMIQ